MKRPTLRAGRQLVLVCFPAAFAGCTPSVDVAGVYFPGWLVSSVAGVAAAYGIVLFLARRSGTRSLADSGLLFVSLVVGIALAVWWVAFSGF
jgi:uncharacterized ion transporter superfamily protein YfcC